MLKFVSELLNRRFIHKNIRFLKRKDFSIIFFSFCVVTSFGMWFPYGDGAVTIVGIKGGAAPRGNHQLLQKKKLRNLRNLGEGS